MYQRLDRLQPVAWPPGPSWQVKHETALQPPAKSAPWQVAQAAALFASTSAP